MVQAAEAMLWTAAGDWIAVDASIADGRLTILPDTADGPSLVVPLVEVCAIDEAPDPADGWREVGIDTTSGIHLDLALDPTFVDAMIAALHALQSPEQTVESFAPYEDSSVSPDARILSVKPVLVRRHDVVVLTLIFFLVVAVSMAAYFAYRGAEASDLASHRLQQLTRTRASLASTSATLKEVTADRDSLDARVSELTNEKAQVQDERNAAQELARLGADAAQQMLDCRDRILDAMTSMASSYYISASAELDAATPVCQRANSAVAAFSDAAGS